MYFLNINHHYEVITVKNIIAIVLLTISMQSQAKMGDAADAPTPPITINIVKPTPSIYE